MLERATENTPAPAPRAAAARPARFARDPAEFASPDRTWLTVIHDGDAARASDEHHDVPTEPRRGSSRPDHPRPRSRCCARLKLGTLLDTLPERLALARTTAPVPREFLELVLADEVTRRDTTSAARRARTAGLDPAMRLDTWDDTAAVRYDHTLWNELTSLRFLDGRARRLHPGARRGRQDAPGHRPRPHRGAPPASACTCSRADQLFKRLKAARLDNSLDAEMRRLAHVDLLIIDDFALQPLDATETADFYELVVARHHQATTVTTSNREPDRVADHDEPTRSSPNPPSTDSPPPPTNSSSKASPTANAKNPHPPIDTTNPDQDARKGRPSGPILMATRWSHPRGK